MAVTLASLVSDVMTLTNRPDLVGETQLAVRAATLKAHQSDYFYKDEFEEGIQFILAQHLQDFQVRDLVPNWRALKYIRKAGHPTPEDPNGTTLHNTGPTTPFGSNPKGFLTLVTPDSVVDSYGVFKEDVCYMAGLTLKIRTRQKWMHFLMGCYVHPDVTVDGYSSWVAEEFPLAIIYEAAGIIFKTIGFDEQRATYRDMANEQIALLKLSNVVANGY